MKGPMKLIEASSGLMECRVCGSNHYANMKSGGGYHRGSFQCSNEQCPSNVKLWDEEKKRFVKPTVVG